jgi:adenosylmethionine-8-amino-7-oxononanoate aminotransferase
LQAAGTKLSKKVEEAELSYMRTDQIFKNIDEYSKRMEHKLQSVASRTQTLLGDSIVLGASVVYLGVFAPEEREQFRAHIIDYLMKMRNIQCNKIWTEFSNA